MSIIEKSGYRPNLQAINLLKGRSNLIGLLVPQIDNAFFVRVIAETEGELRRRGYNVMLCHTNEDEETERNFLDILSAQRVAGLIASPVGINSAGYKAIVRNIPTVILARHFANLPVSWVDLDNYGASYNLVRHLLEQGNRRIAIISSESGLSSVVDRLQGARDACGEFGLGADDVHVINSGLLFEDAYAATLAFMRKRRDITAIYSLHTMPALGALKALDELGVKVPEQVSLAAFNGMDDSPYSSLFSRPLTGNRHPTRQMCHKAIELLLRQIEAREKSSAPSPFEHIVFPLELVERESSQCQRKTQAKAT